MTLTNTGAAALSISSIVATGGHIQSNHRGTSLAAGAACIHWFQDLYRPIKNQSFSVKR